MRILAIDIGTGTQDILVFDSEQPPENSIKLVMPSPTQIAAGRIRHATAVGRAVVLTGVVQGGGPCAWALEDHLRAGLAAFATPAAARTFNDEIALVEATGVRIVSDDEAASIGDAGVVELRDLDLTAIRAALAAFDVPGDFDGIAVGCLDHGEAPPGYSDRLFRFDHLRRVVAARNDLRAFAFLPAELPDYLTRARAAMASVEGEAPAVFMDTGPAAGLGALQDPKVGASARNVVLNLGNMHTLAFHLEGTRILSLYEHHTGEITADQVVRFTERMVSGELAHEEIFESKGHGAFHASGDGNDSLPPVAVTGPQRSKVRGTALDPYFAAPHGDMMISGCFGLLVGFAEKYPGNREAIERALAGA